MTYHEREEVRLKRQSSKHAVALAMQGRWREAVAANMSIIEHFPNDAAAYNRLGRAHMELGEYAHAKKAYQRAVELDPYNAIARKNLGRLSRLAEAMASTEADPRTAEPHSFIEEVGKAGMVSLLKLAPPEVLAKVVAGDKVYLRRDEGSLKVENGHGEYLGEVEPRYAQRLIKLMEGGNQYAAAIVRVTESAVVVIIREVYQDPSQAGKLSFPPRGFEEPRISMGDMILKRELEYEESAVEEPGYTIIDVDEEGMEVKLKEPLETDEEEEKPEGEEG